MKKTVRNLFAATTLGAALLGAAFAHAETTVSAPSPAQSRFDMLDTNKDGVLSRDEFLAQRPTGAREGRHGGMRKVRADRGDHTLFALSEKAADGVVMRADVEKLGRPNALSRFDAMDTNKDGKLTADERAACARIRS
ncbi:MAG: hypothetical protein CGU28_09525 [Candidatus Dactylopiibacterium carminicum]|uniref:EF-hand domain-containing protein n=1 Tax=Candidatus Dactylopiibacterium carminicum TaxID=857335 RepID=A0A272ES07_9RHOO|nr:EF-hand domain-containing protein [Candidatus Dactylopiibacterium carminicum]KAF7598904.1 hypothetical protein BGI27_10815 [Candidatus Dactylopiibacterium carminicum]PAS92816.1 MAG: hypothetical protein CGU29_10115 [Candidatus Dactylopiibacterium carminicum]PAS96267.1 MAG: hypothetical protein CGU28_09525 [Candidatus Dactylopiibacterium carminicum]PAS98903.1 MAG: hypothetical protein BSR46_10835 [Candidatus Dactylopiibacterium carminicum]